MQWIIFVFLKTHVIFKDENNTKPLVVSNEHDLSYGKHSVH